MAIFDGKAIIIQKDMGLVSEVFPKRILASLIGFRGIGHVRYSTTGYSKKEETQPYCMYLTGINFAIAFNGNISNSGRLKEELEEKGHFFETDTDTELIAKYIATFMLENGRDLIGAIQKLIDILDGGYSMLILTEGGHILALRDPYGYRPLVFGRQKDGSIVFSSETVALNSTDTQYIDDVNPGEVILVTDNGYERLQLVESKRYAHCQFEYVYFSRPDSEMEGISVYEVRRRLGRKLAELYPVEADVVIPVPDSGRTAALGYSEVSGIPLSEGLIKNRYVFRTFIMPRQNERENAVRLKMNPIPHVVSGKRIVLVDDSIVRGTSMKHIVSLLRKAGAKEVHVRISCPPIISPCYCGIDFQRREELIRGKTSLEETRKIIGADSLEYMKIDGLVEAIGLGKNELCLSCLTGEYLLKEAPTTLGRVDEEEVKLQATVQETKSF